MHQLDPRRRGTPSRMPLIAIVSIAACSNEPLDLRSIGQEVVFPSAEQWRPVVISDPAGDGNVAITEIAEGVFSNNPDYLLDFSIPLANFAAAGIPFDQIVRFTCGTSSNGTNMGVDPSETSGLFRLDGTSVAGDGDGDGVPDEFDNCPMAMNQDQGDV